MIDFLTSLPILTHYKRNSYNSILVIVDRPTKMIYYKSVNIAIDLLGLIKVLINIIVYHYGLLDLILTNRSLRFNSKFWSLLYYFLGMKCWLSIIFDLQNIGQTKRQNCIIKVNFQTFIKFKWDNWAKFLPIAELADNNTKNMIMAIHFLSGIVTTIFISHWKKILIFTPNWKQLTSYLPSYMS